MAEAVKKILAYQQTPMILSCIQTGEIPPDFLITLTEEEREYVLTRTLSPVEPMFYELLPRLGAAGVVCTISPLILDVHSKPAKVFASIDEISLPLAHEPGTREYLFGEYVQPFHYQLKRLTAKTQQRFGEAHVVHLTILPHFTDGKQTPFDIVTYGNPCLSEAVHEPEEFQGLYEKSTIRFAEKHTWIGIHPKLFATRTLRQELLERLAKMKQAVLA